MIHIVDYDMGNLRSVQNALESIGESAVATSDPDVVRRAERVIVPGVGAFPDAMTTLRRSGMDQAIVAFAQTGRPLLGVCLGMQIFFDRSEEYGEHEGLGLFPGSVLGFPADLRDAAGASLKVPHMGWNTLAVSDVPALAPLAPLHGQYVYFVHSFYVAPSQDSDVAAVTEYGLEFCSMAARDNIWAAQFHPEKSAAVGADLLRAFAQRT